MNQRQRFLATAGFQPVDRAFLLAPWVWPATLARWRAEGFREGDLSEAFQTDREMSAPVAMQGPHGPHPLPAFERTVLQDSPEHQVVRDEEDNTVRLLKDDPTRSMPEWIEYPMSGRREWERIIKPRLDARIAGRAPHGQALIDYAKSAEGRDCPLGAWCGSFYGCPRSLLGLERLSVLFHVDSGLIYELKLRSIVEDPERHLFEARRRGFWQGETP